MKYTKSAAEARLESWENSSAAHVAMRFGNRFARVSSEGRGESAAAVSWGLSSAVAHSGLEVQRA